MSGSAVPRVGADGGAARPRLRRPLELCGVHAALRDVTRFGPAK